MQVASPISKPSPGKTFVVAMSIICLAALLLIGALAWIFISRYQAEQYAEMMEAKRAATLPVHVTAPKISQTPDHSAPQITATAIPKPTPVPQSLQMQTAPAAASAQSRVDTLVKTAQALRERGDTATAIIRLREALAIAPGNPQVLSEIAITYDRMGVSQKAAEYWRKVYDIGESAGIYYVAAAAKLIAPPPSAPAAPANHSLTANAGNAVQPGSALGLMTVNTVEDQDSLSQKKFSLQIPVKAREGSDIDNGQVTIQVLFYDIINDKSIVQTVAKVSSRWITSPVDWANGDIEVLQVDYNLPKLDPKDAATEQRNYYGYIVRLYYKGELQDVRADPITLLKKFPPPIHLSTEPPAQ